ncbi:MAM and LDL-receptor class A domain-containing protein 1-like [Penaeus monodon]|uniref:MAM and LDL-receptor class A domain-containing protein 1-like n=1 Tax=Penaeus monodon TaxID=6687 RepID=UPI0018A79FCF|nr:MAM and LDL-receptor class A domain-containing protein 1-like [Penaeus monodon]
MSGRGGQRLQVVLDEEELLFDRENTNIFSDEWLQGTYQWTSVETMPSRVNLTLRAVVGIPQDSTTTYHAVDDVAVFAGECPTVLSTCTVEGGDTCGWSNTFAHDDMDWLVFAGPSPSSPDAGPSFDYTLGDSDPLGGHYLVLDSHEAGEHRMAALRSHLLPGHGAYCLSFYYFMKGSHVGRLEVRTWSSVGGLSGSEKVVWVLYGAREGTWQYGSVGITAEEDVWIAFQGSVLSAGGGDIGLDDITVSKEACGVQPPEAEVSPSEPPETEPPVITEWSCDFEDEGDWLCGLREVAGGWQVKAGWDAAEGTNPPLDHTTSSGDGHMLYLPGSKTEQAKLETPSLGFSGDSEASCLSLWYRIPTSDAGTLKAFMKDFNKEDNVPVLQVDGSWGSKDWLYAQTWLNPTTSGQFEVRLRGEPGGAEDAGIAVDDVRITAGSCPWLRQCEFQDSTCLWEVEAREESFQWTVTTGQDSHGPEKDHTFNENSGGYLTAYTNGTTPGVSSTLKSVTLPPSATCLNFWWAISGPGVGTLQILLKGVSWESWKVVWSLDNPTDGDAGAQGEWHPGSVPYNHTDSGLVLAFHVINHKKNSGWIALDDVAAPPPPQ